MSGNVGGFLCVSNPLSSNPGNWPKKIVILNFRSLPLTVLLHGFSDRGDTLWINKVKRKMFYHNISSNILVPDWSKLAKSPWYNLVVKNIE